MAVCKRLFSPSRISNTLALAGIMIKGALRTVGSSQQLKAQHGSGYRVAVRLRDGGEAASSGGSSSVDKLALAICKSANVEDGEKGFSLQRFEVPMAGAGAGPSDEGATLGHIFSTILEHQDALNIVDFSGALLCPCELVPISHALLNMHASPAQSRKPRSRMCSWSSLRASSSYTAAELHALPMHVASHASIARSSHD